MKKLKSCDYKNAAIQLFDELEKIEAALSEYELCLSEVRLEIEGDKHSVNEQTLSIDWNGQEGTSFSLTVKRGCE